MLGGDGDEDALRTAIGWSGVPETVRVPLLVATLAATRNLLTPTALESQSLLTAPGALTGAVLLLALAGAVLLLALAGWHIVLLVAAVAEAHCFSSGRAVGTNAAMLVVIGLIVAGFRLVVG